MSDSRKTFLQSEALNRLEGFDVTANPEHRAALSAVLDASAGTEQFVTLVEKFSVSDRYDDLLELAQENAQGQLAINAVKALLNKQYRGPIREALWSEDAETAEKTIAALGTAADGRSVSLLMDLSADEELPVERRRAAIKALGSVRPGALALQELAQKGEYDAALKEAIAATLHTVQWKGRQGAGAQAFPAPSRKGTAGRCRRSRNSPAARATSLTARSSVLHDWNVQQMPCCEHDRPKCRARISQRSARNWPSRRCTSRSCFPQRRSAITTRPGLCSMWKETSSQDCW